jgi:hypothetical protein
MSDNPTLTVAINLREIARLADMLEDQAYHHASDREFPGGDAFVQSAPVANQEAWSNRFDTAERKWLAGEGPAPFTEDDDETALQLLEFWWERWVFELDGNCETQLNLREMAAWLSKPDVMAWAEQWEARFDAYTEDVAEARRILENTLLDGDRSVFGVQCPRCHEKSLVRVTEPRLKRPCSGHGQGWCPWPKQGCCDRGGLQERWTCPNCEHNMGLADYQSAVMRDYIANAPYLLAEHIEQRTWVKPGTVRVWASRADANGMRVRTRRDSTDRATYCVEDVEAMRDTHAAERETDANLTDVSTFV